MTNRERKLFLKESKRINTLWEQLSEQAQLVIAQTDMVVVGAAFSGMTAEEINNFVKELYPEDYDIKGLVGGDLLDDDLLMDDPMEELRPCE